MRTALRTAVLALIADQIFKIELGARLETLIPGVLGLRPALNTGAAFSLPLGGPLVSLFLTGLIILSLIYLLRINPPKGLSAVLAGLVIGGALGNFLDRLLLGAVRDYLELLFIPFPIFNLADACICVGCFGFALLSLREDRREDHA